MKNRLFQLFIILYILLVTFTGYYTFAWFAKSAVSSNNTFTAGTLEISCPGDEATSDTVNINGIFPSGEISRDFSITNSGTLDYEYCMYVDTTNLTGNILYDGSHPIQLKIMREGIVIKDYTPINELGYVDMDSMKVGNVDNITVWFKLSEFADDSYQGVSAPITFVFEAKQDAVGALYPEDNSSSNVIYVRSGTIMEAIKKASEGDTIIVTEARNYYEDIVIDKPLTLLGIHKNTPAYGSGRSITGDPTNESIITSTGGGTAITLTGAGTSNVTIKGFSIREGGGMRPSVGIKVEKDINNVTIENNIFYNTIKEGIDLKDISRNNLIIRGNAFSNWTENDITAVSLLGGGSINTIIDSNYIEGQNASWLKGSRGIRVGGSQNVRITNNTIKSVKSTGIQFGNGGNGIICSGNNITGAGTAAIQILTDGNGKMKDVTISNNIITDAGDHGIYVRKSSSTPSTAVPVENLLIENNIIRQDTQVLTSNTGGIWICLDPAANPEHGKISILNNNISFYNNKKEYADSIFGIALMGKLNTVDILDNTLNGAGNINTGICIRKVAHGYGTTPKNAIINCPLDSNTIEGFVINKLLDER